MRRLCPSSVSPTPPKVWATSLSDLGFVSPPPPDPPSVELPQGVPVHTACPVGGSKLGPSRKIDRKMVLGVQISASIGIVSMWRRNGSRYGVHAPPRPQVLEGIWPHCALGLTFCDEYGHMAACDAVVLCGAVGMSAVQDGGHTDTHGDTDGVSSRLDTLFGSLATRHPRCRMMCVAE